MKPPAPQIPFVNTTRQWNQNFAATFKTAKCMKTCARVPIRAKLFILSVNVGLAHDTFYVSIYPHPIAFAHFSMCFWSDPVRYRFFFLTSVISSFLQMNRCKFAKDFFQTWVLGTSITISFISRRKSTDTLVDLLVYCGLSNIWRPTQEFWNG